MARQVLPIVGAVVGAYFGNPQAGYAIGAIIGNEIDPLKVNGPRIGDASIQTSAEGVYRPIVMGTAAVKGNLIHRINRVIKKSESREGKGGPVTVTERVYWTFAIRIAEGPIGNILRIWQDEKLVYDVRPESDIVEDTSNYRSRFNLYLGDEAQLPDPALEGWYGIGNVNAYRGTAYIVFPNFDLTDQGERVPDFRFEVVVGESETVWTPKIVLDKEFFTGTFASIDGPHAYAGMGAPSVLGAGNKEISVSPAGDLVAYAVSASPYLSVRRLDQDTGLWSPVTITGTMPGPGVRSACFSPDGKWLVVGAILDANNLYVYKVDGYTITFHAQPSVAIAQPINYIEFSPVNELLFACTKANTDPVKLFSIAPASIDLVRDFGVLLSHGEFSNSQMVQWRPSGDMILYFDNGLFKILHAETGELIYSTFIGSGISMCFWSGALDFFYLCKNTSPALTAYRWLQTGDTFAMVEYPVSDQPAGTIGKSRISFDRRYLVCAGGTGNSSLYIYATNLMNMLTPVSTEALTGGGGQSLALVDGPSSGTANPASTTLTEILETLHDRASRSPVPFSSLGVEAEVSGVVFSGSYTCADAIATFMPIYNFDASEFDGGDGYKIHYVERGGAVKRTLTEDDLVDIPDSTVRKDALEYPKVLHMQFQSPVVGYATAKATVRRNSPDVQVTGEKAIEVPIAFGDVNEAWQRADRLMRITWVEVAGEEEFTLSDKHIDLVATDCIGLSLRGQLRRLRITQQSVQDGTLPIKAILDRQSAVTSNLTGVPLPLPTPPQPQTVGPSVDVFLDIPAMVDTNDSLGYYVGVSGQTEAWHGAVVQRRLPSDADFADVLAFSRGSIVGVLQNSVAMASEHHIDTTNVVQLQLLVDGEIQSITQQQFLSEGGSFAIQKAGGGWEVLQYRDAEEIGDRTFSLSYLARGRLNSGASAHLAGQYVVMLDTVKFVEAQSSWIGQSLVQRAVSFGTSPESAVQHTYGFSGLSQIEFPVAQVLLARAGSTINARAIPRHRFGTEDRPVRSGNWSGYRWVVTDGTNSTTQDGITDDMAFDVTGWSSPVTVTVSQLNRITGPGPSKSEQIA